MTLIKMIEDSLNQIEDYTVLYNVTTKDSIKKHKNVKILELKYLQVKYDKSGRYAKEKYSKDKSFQTILMNVSK